MLSLILIRHAKSSWKNTELDDIERPLKKRGVKDAIKIGKLLYNREEIPELLITSPAERALSTAGIIAAEIGYPQENIIKEELLYMAGYDDFIRVISRYSAGKSKIMMVSHNPGITDFVNSISRAEIDNIPTCGVVRLDFTDAESAVKGLQAKLVYFEYPKKLK